MLSTDPVDLLLDSTGDLVVTSDLQWAVGLPAIAQGIRIALQLFRGEWFLDLDEGVPYLEREGVSADDALLGAKFNHGRAVAAFRDAIRRAPGVNSIVSLNVTFDRATRKVLASWIVRTEFGDTKPDSLKLGV